MIRKTNFYLEKLNFKKKKKITNNNWRIDDSIDENYIIKIWITQCKTTHRIIWQLKN